MRREDARGWQLCDACDQPINPKHKPGTPTPERPVTIADGDGRPVVRWVHRNCEDRPEWVVIA